MMYKEEFWKIVVERYQIMWVNDSIPCYPQILILIFEKRLYTSSYNFPAKSYEYLKLDVNSFMELHIRE